jgi:hypothetical protein
MTEAEERSAMGRLEWWNALAPPGRILYNPGVLGMACVPVERCPQFISLTIPNLTQEAGGR